MARGTSGMPGAEPRTMSSDKQSHLNTDPYEGNLS